MVNTRGHTDHQGFAPTLVYFCDYCHPREEFSWQINVLLLWIRRQAEGEKLGFYHCSSVPQSKQTWDALDSQLAGTGSFQLLACKGISINKASQMVQESRIKRLREREREREVSIRREKWGKEFYSWKWYEASKLQMCQLAPLVKRRSRKQSWG